MNTLSQVLAVSDWLVHGIAPVVAGILITGALVWAVRFGMKVRSAESPPPLPEEQPRLPEYGAVHEVSEMREPDEMPKSADSGHPLTPYEIKGVGNVASRKSGDQHRRRWSPGSSGSFGSGGPGRT
ncbi:MULTISPECIES: DUF6479 family protein [unclassified Streptomyces]|uniref:DUF6479 family protein n=1 Tax=unclassified Streptomyces TaxID=2593676 RepID=UPI0033ABEFE4